MFIMKHTAKKVSLQLSFESSGRNSLSEWGWEIVPILLKTAITPEATFLAEVKA